MDICFEKKIQKIQNMCLRFIFNIRKRDNNINYNALLVKLGWLNMKQKTIKNGLVMLYKILHGLAPNYLTDPITLTSEIHNINTRRTVDSIWLSKSITSKIHRKSFYFFMANIYNNIPEDIKKSKSVTIFKKAISKHIKEGNMVIPR